MEAVIFAWTAAYWWRYGRGAIASARPARRGSSSSDPRGHDHRAGREEQRVPNASERRPRLRSLAVRSGLWGLRSTAQEEEHGWDGAQIFGRGERPPTDLDYSPS